MKKLLTLSLTLLAFNTHADVLRNLSKTPASQLELGKLSLDIFSYVATKELEGKELANTNFKFIKVDSIKDPRQIGYIVSFSGKSRYLTDENCAIALTASKAIFAPEKILPDIWPNLSEMQYNELYQQFILKTELVSKENENLKVTCD
ncbi:hypothetical protein [Marinomonas fungiae]|uniref:hypothetical protein n=1 Tax=Marinomonas fungiae TaxID=1137284 RepID=UPI003A918D87